MDQACLLRFHCLVAPTWFSLYGCARVSAFFQCTEFFIIVLDCSIYWDETTTELAAVFNKLSILFPTKKKKKKKTNHPKKNKQKKKKNTQQNNKQKNTKSHTTK